jgi:stage III sporulation protein SpoIIIAA
MDVIKRMSPFLLPDGPSLPPFASSISSTVRGSTVGAFGGMLPQPFSPLEKKANLLSSKSLLLIGKPSVGKTTLLRELAQNLSEDLSSVVCVVDKICEIAGDGESPHHAIGSSRWKPVSRPGLQAQILRECVENQSPDVIICDEISTSKEVECVRSISQRSISQRGVSLITTVHGSTLPELVNDGKRRNLVSGHLN